MGLLLAFGVLVALLFWVRPWSYGPVALVAPDPAANSELAVSSQSGAVLEMPEADPEPQSATPETGPLDFTITAGGDMLIHMPVADSAWTGSEWDFSPLMEPVAPYLQGSEIALCNMETAMVPRDQAPSGFPIFGTPADLAPSMARSGWNGCSTSSNHSLDQGLGGVSNTIGFLEEAGLGHAGTARSEVEAGQPQFYEIRSQGQTVTVAHIAAADNTNGIPIPSDAPWSIQMIDIPALEDLARTARADGADIVVASLHCCQIEYDTNVEPYQEETARALAESGLVDVYISHHPHVPRPIALLEGGPNGNGMWVAYSLGNFISNQRVETTGSVESATGLLTFFNGVKEAGEPARITAAEWMAVTMDEGHVVRPLIRGEAQGALLDPGVLADRYARLSQLLADGPATEVVAVPTTGDNETVTVTRG